METVTCPNCESKMNAGDSCPECNHRDDDSCECQHCGEICDVCSGNGWVYDPDDGGTMECPNCEDGRIK